MRMAGNAGGTQIQTTSRLHYECIAAGAFANLHFLKRQRALVVRSAILRQQRLLEIVHGKSKTHTRTGRLARL